jgi:hypothetical protein
MGYTPMKYTRSEVHTLRGIALEVHAHEMHAHEVHAHEMHVYEIHTYKVYAQ